jgi:rfaE bifunctional protein kinase chain/domain
MSAIPVKFSAWRERVAAAHVLVVGDVMLDRYWFGDVERISPEAPVAVAKIVRTEERPGGAANVARNIAALGATATLLSVIGADEAGNALERLLEGERVTPLFLRDPAITTTVKLRVIARQQQLLRIDFEQPPSRELLSAKLADYERLLGEVDVVVMSDYGKGGLAHIATMIDSARASGTRVLVDPKGEDWAKYRGANLLTPNLGELRQVIGRWHDEQELARKAQWLRS